jgi:hypothetical protein
MTAALAGDDLWRLTSDCPSESVQWLALGWRLGLLDGWDEGWTSAERDMAIRWHEVWLATRRVIASPTRTELARRRGEAS